ncbi:hypothetical protein [Bosea sp. BIWAKO-01]|uniref:hypothetical protein n=1 Tax=Bosea sp. BIWAKO-01 TaxID=506668 RepID=UPI0008538336|nr:hypothetical protein [Bosea sp. BIWAKO-01]GAU87044.1 hypothetical protein BIWAKO_06997 [Bosea sp. BIWAKO-01]
MPKLAETKAGTPLQERGRARLMLRLPVWRAAFAQTFDYAFLDICEAYELAWNGLEFWINSDAPTRSERIEEYQQLMASLELEAASSAAAESRDWR